jgi:hypothetical protein
VLRYLPEVHTGQNTLGKALKRSFRLRNPLLTILKETINVGLKLCSNICHSDL